jgi:hypothetical protein
VTSHSDFKSRATSLLTGGQDLIGKPFLPFELAVKALTLVFLRRLQAQSAGAGTGLRALAKAAIPVSTRMATAVPADPTSEAAAGNGRPSVKADEVRSASTSAHRTLAKEATPSPG